MTLTLTDIVVLLGLPIDQQTITSSGFCNRIVLCERPSRLTPIFLNQRRVAYILSGLRKYFMTSPADTNEEVM